MTTETTTPVIPATQPAPELGTMGEPVNNKELLNPVQTEVEKKTEETTEEKKVDPPVEESPEPKVEDEIVDTDYVTYGHAGADAAVQMLKESGVTLEESQAIFSEVAKTGDFTKLDYKALEAKVGKTKADLITAGVKDFYVTEQAKATEITNAVITTVGGEANMKEITAWLVKEKAKNPALAAEVAVYGEMMQQGTVQAKTAAKALLELYNAGKDTSGLNNNLIEGDSAGHGTIEFIDRPTFIEQLQVAERSGNTAEAAKLRARRAATMKAGKA